MDETLTMAYKTPAELICLPTASQPHFIPSTHSILPLWCSRPSITLLLQEKLCLSFPLHGPLLYQIFTFHFSTLPKILQQTSFLQRNDLLVSWSLLMFVILGTDISCYVIHIILCNTILYYIIVYCLSLYWYISPTGVGTWSLSFVVSPAFRLNPLL